MEICNSITNITLKTIFTTISTNYVVEPKECFVIRIIGQMAHSEKILTKAVLTAAQKIGLTHDQLAMILDINLSITNIDCCKFSLPQKEIALKLIRITVAVDNLSGGNISTIQYFMKSPNKITKGIPLDQIQNISELETVLQFVEGLQAKP